MSNFLIALVASLGAGGWIFAKMQHQSGAANSAGSVKAAAVATVIIFIVLFTLAQMILK